MCATNKYWGVNSYSCPETQWPVSVYKGINDNFPERTQTVQCRNINILYFRPNAQSHRGYLNTFECVWCLRWHTCLAMGAVKGAGLWDGLCRLTNPSVAKLKTCSRTYPDWLGLLLCQLLTRQRKLQPWPHAACQTETLRSNFAYTEKKVGEGGQGGDEGTDLYKHCGFSSLELGAAIKLTFNT